MKRSLAVGSKNGFSLFSLNSIDSALEEIYTSSGEEINIVERLFSSSLVAVVSLNAPRKLKASIYYYITTKPLYKNQIRRGDDGSQMSVSVNPAPQSP